MAVLTKTLIATNLHKYSIELEKAFEEGWRLNKSVVARRSLGNKFTAQLVRESVGELLSTTVTQENGDVVVQNTLESVEDTSEKALDVEALVEDKGDVKDEVVEQVAVPKVTKSKTAKAKPAPVVEG